MYPCRSKIESNTGSSFTTYDQDYVASYQGNLIGESVVAAILPSRMAASYCTSGFFSS